MNWQFFQHKNILFLLVFLSFLLTSFDKPQKTYCNLALNPADVNDEVWTPENGYPHATSNSEYPGDSSDPSFWALNAIDGKTENRGHGKDFPSWGPEKRTDLWWKVNFGKEVEVNKVVIYIRADFKPYTPQDHDGYWVSAKLRFSDGSVQSIQLKRTADPQVFELKTTKTSFVQITDLVEEGPLMWCSFNEVEVWGYR